MDNPKYIGWRGLDGIVHICSMDDFENQVIKSFRWDVYPPKIWDTLFIINVNAVSESNFIEAKNIIKSNEISLIGIKLGHPLLVESISSQLSVEYKTQLSKIRVVYIYDNLEKHPNLVDKYVTKLQGNFRGY